MKDYLILLSILLSWNVLSSEAKIEDNPRSGKSLRKMSKDYAQEQLSQALSDFSFDMFGNITEKLNDDENMAFSPISLYSVFSMLVEGLDGKSREQVERFLHFDQVKGNRLRRKLSVKESQLCRLVFAPTNDYTLVQANAIYMDNDFVLLPDYSDIMTTKFRAKIEMLSFQLKPKKARRRINKFVARKTQNLIPELLSEESITRDTRLVLLNTIYMKASWEYPFMKESEAYIDSFWVSPSEKINTTFMFTSQARCQNRESASLEAELLIMPFVGDNLQMVIFMPHTAGDFSRFNQANSSDLVTAELQMPSSMRFCQISLPKFTVSHRLNDLKMTLKSMGVVDIFDESLGNFTRMTSSDGIYVQEIAHKTVLEVNEDGVTAVASSAITTGVRAAFPHYHIMQPFVFMIRHVDTGAILFLGRVVRPE